jgi:hypothetical protein
VGTPASLCSQQPSHYPHWQTVNGRYEVKGVGYEALRDVVQAYQMDCLYSGTRLAFPVTGLAVDRFEAHLAEGMPVHDALKILAQPSFAKPPRPPVRLEGSVVR